MGSSSDTAIPADWASRRGAADGVAGLSARIRLGVDGATVGVLKVDDGGVEIVPDGEAAATVTTDTLQTLVGLLGGDVQPIVARLQGRVLPEGDIGLVIRVFFGLQAGSPWSGLAPKPCPA
ncbi:SCP2 sterol-binding domain-containing protein [Phenylobacterium sp. LjRoot219]|uniref:hypothetical protein n=1 Tax=Phenylobacterium sp. LjRoot219 TaxID=3342283 RepID=UPI003ECD3F0C